MGVAAVRAVYCKTLLNRTDVPGMPFRWSLNPYRGCSHACNYCFARPTHQFGGPDAGREFEQRVFAKVNAPQVLCQELSRPQWHREPIIIGTASDPYEPAEAEYLLTRRILQVLAEFENPAAITTKGVLVRRDVDVLRDLGRVAHVRVIFSVGSIDERVWRLTEPGAPDPWARLEAMQFLVENGISAGVVMAPLLPGISDSSQSIDAVAAAAASHQAQFLEANLLFLNPGSREGFMPSLGEAYPRLVPAYARLYRRTYAPQAYKNSVLKVVAEARRKWGLPASAPWRSVQAPQRQLQLALSA
ncbi:MAG: radical SAM protein [Dehalococcoidia bacterium]|nr:radical SAM protein [Dehalococcoidia bacterium]MDP7083803.1 radical SAM protein [Dehalococcoidia bacterium]